MLSPSPQAVGVYNLTLQAADMSGDGLTTTATAVIYLEDVNDNAPEFTKEEVVGAGRAGCGAAAPREVPTPPPTLPQFSMEVEEQAAGAEVGRVLVHDKDLAGSPNWAAKFTILEGDPEGAFAIHTDPHTNDGVLSVAKVGGGAVGVGEGGGGGMRAPVARPLTPHPHPLRSRWTTRCGTASS